MSNKLKNMSEEEKKKYEKAEMVGWYDPTQLFNTGVMTAISKTIGEYADPRMSAPAPQNRKPFDYSKQLKQTEDGEFLPFDADEKDSEISHHEREEIWIDYAADVGDGWNSTYGVAYNLAQPTLNAELKKFNKETGKEEVSQEETTRGEILIFGGDGVYPTAEATKYESRLIMPYRMAFRAGGTAESDEGSAQVDLKKSPHLFALPGNHDWYDSLVAFRKLFCSHIFNGRRFADYEEKDANGETIRRGGWRTRQRRSYFALKLPRKWWLLAVDMQLSHNIDIAQLDFFMEIITEDMKPGDKVILCVPEPYWVKAIKYEGMTEKFEEKEASIEKLEDFLREHGIGIKAYIAGDLHHYRRFADEKNGVQKITAGGGGGFLHPTHDFDFEKQEEGLKKKEKKTDKEIERARFRWQKNYPEFKDSRKKDWRTLLFPIKNPWFGTITAVVYALIAWLLHGELTNGTASVNKFIAALRGSVPFFSTLWEFLYEAHLATTNRLIDNPLATIVVLLLLVAVGFFTDSNKKLYKWLGGILHGLVHLAAIFFLGWAAYLLSEYLSGKYQFDGQTNRNLIWLACVLIVPAIGGYILGAIIMGVYLFVSLHLFGRHDNEAFSALKIEDYKNFLRMHINGDGLTIYSFKIDTVAKNWKDVMAGGEIIYRTPKEENKAGLIEKIEVKG